MCKGIKSLIKMNKKNLVLSITLILCIVVFAFTFAINNYLGKINKVDIDKSDLNFNSDLSKNENNNLDNDEIKNIALFGIDETDGILGRSDCIMIFTIDNKHKNMKLISFVRDSYVTIPTKANKDKINHAYAFGGPQLALKTLNENFELNLDKFITVNFSSLPKLIDNIGKIEINITNDELNFINDYIKNLNKLNGTTSPNIMTPGLQEIDGTQALAYCRIRYTSGGDFERTNRHRIILNELIKKFKAIQITEYPNLLNEFLPLIQTNLSISDLLRTSLNINSLKSQPILQDRFPSDEDGEGKSIGGIYYYVFDNVSTTKKIHNFIYTNNS